MASIHSASRRIRPYGATSGSFWIVLTILTTICCVVWSDTIYLTPGDGSTWLGNCNETRCTWRTPCSANSSLTITLTGAEACSISFGPGVYSSIHMDGNGMFDSQRGFNISFQGAIRRLQLALERIPSTIYFQGENADLMDSKLDVTLLNPLFVRSLRLANSKLIASDQPTTMEDTILDSSSASLLRSGSVTLRRVQSKSSTWTIDASGALTLDDCRFSHPWVPEPPNSIINLKQQTMVTVMHSTFTIPFSSTIFSASTLLLADFTLLKSTLIGNASNSATLTNANVGIHLESSQFSDLVIQGGTSSFTAINSRFENVAINIRSTSMWQNVSITQLRPNCPVTFSDPAGPNIDGLAFSNPSNASNSTLSFTDSSTIAVNTISTFLVSHLELSGPLTATYLEVTDSIVCKAGPCSISPPSTSPQYWNFHSIEIRNVSIAGGKLNLTYTPSQPSLGIRANRPLFPPWWSVSDISIGINWHPELPPPIYMATYPVINFPRDPISGLDPSGNYSLQQTSSSLLYHFTAQFINPPLLSITAWHSGQYHVPCVNPPPGFVCSPGGTLYSPIDVNQTSITIPSQSGNVVVIGNVTSGTGITFVGTGSQLNATGCITGDQLSLTLQDGEPLPKGSLTLLTQSSSCGALNIPFTLKSNAKKSCKTITAQRDPNAPSHQLSILFKVDDFQCNVKWIIIGATLGSVLIIVVILVLVFALNKKARLCIRPYSARAPKG